VHHSGINPTVGRVAYAYWPERWKGHRAADIVGVLPDGRVTIRVKPNHHVGDSEFSGIEVAKTDTNPEWHMISHAGRNTITCHIFTEGQETPEGLPLADSRVADSLPFATWMPYQTGQAPSSAELIRKIENLERIAYAAQDRALNAEAKLTAAMKLVETAVMALEEQGANHAKAIEEIRQTQTSGVLEAVNANAALPAERLDVLEEGLRLRGEQVDNLRIDLDGHHHQEVVGANGATTRVVLPVQETRTLEVAPAKT
jgi:hypothetical protein